MCVRVKIGKEMLFILVVVVFASWKGCSANQNALHVCFTAHGYICFSLSFFRVFFVDDALKQKEFMLKQMNINEEFWFFNHYMFNKKKTIATGNYYR